MQKGTEGKEFYKRKIPTSRMNRYYVACTICDLFSKVGQFVNGGDFLFFRSSSPESSKIASRPTAHLRNVRS